MQRLNRIQRHGRGIEWTPWERPGTSAATVATVTMEPR